VDKELDFNSRFALWDKTAHPQLAIMALKRADPEK
jgi:hypothetical protein